MASVYPRATGSYPLTSGFRRQLPESTLGFGDYTRVTMDIQKRRDIPGDLGILGVGAIAEAIITGLCDDEDIQTSIHLSPRSAVRADRLAARYPSVRVADSNQAVVERADVVLLCLRPQDGPAALLDLAFRAHQAVISVKAGVPIDALRPLVAPAGPIVRAIPLPAVARRSGLTAIHPPHELARAIFDPLGGVIAVDDERALDALFASTATIAAYLSYLDTSAAGSPTGVSPRPTQRGTSQQSSHPCPRRCPTLNRTTSGPSLTSKRPSAGSTNSSSRPSAAQAHSTSSTAHSTTWPIDSKANESGRIS
jgi:hypothetical protein